MHIKYLLLFFTFLFCLSFSSNRKITSADNLKINQIQIIASHNSYHLKTSAAVLRFLSFLHSLRILPAEMNPKYIDYTDTTLTAQLETYHVRGLELDVWNDPEGGRYYDRMGNSLVWQKIHSGVKALQQPGFKIIHIPDFDYNTTVYTFKQALSEIKQWSDAHPKHLPLFINIETKTFTAGDQIHALQKLTKSAPFDSLAANNLDREVKNIFGESLTGILTPDQVRGTYSTLEEAVLAGNWPTIAQARGKIVFIIDGNGNPAEIYKAGHPSLKGRAMFVYSKPGTPESAFVVFNEPLKNFEQIQQSVKQGYIVRTRSDENTLQARTGDYSQMHTAFASGAQIISTDYCRPDSRAGKHGWTNYHVQFPNRAVAQIDSVSTNGISEPVIIDE